MKCSIQLKKHCERAWERELPTPFINHTHKELFTCTAYCWSSLGCLLTYIIYLVNHTHTHIKYRLPSLVLDLVLVALETAWERDSYLLHSPHQSHIRKTLFTFIGTTYSWSNPGYLSNSPRERELHVPTSFTSPITHVYKTLFTFTGTTYSSSSPGCLLFLLSF